MSKGNSPEQYTGNDKEESATGSLRMTRGQHAQIGSSVPPTYGLREGSKNKDMPILDTMSMEERIQYFREMQQQLLVLGYILEREEEKGQNPEIAKADKAIHKSIKEQFEDNLRYAQDNHLLPKEFEDLAQAIAPK